MNPPGWLNAAYQRCLAWYRVKGLPWPRRLFERSVALVTRLLMAATGLRFPHRAIGGWWWIWRFRFEILTGLYEWDTAWWCRRLVEPGMTVLDVGAHIGYYSRRFSRWVGPQGRGVAFEASPENIPVLKHNLGRNRRNNIECVFSAVTNRVGQVGLHVSAGHSNHSLIEGYAGTGEVIPVPAITLDAYRTREGLEHVDLIKSDTEGSELAVLEGAQGTIESNPQLAMIVECNPRALPAAGHSARGLASRLYEFGFAVWEIGPGRKLAPVSLTEAKETRNWLCLRLTHPQYPLACGLAAGYDGLLKEQLAK